MLHVAMLDSPTEQSIHDTLSSICFRVETPECINAASITLFKPYSIQTPSMTCAQILEPFFAFKALKTFEVDFFHMHTFTDEDAGGSYPPGPNSPPSLIALDGRRPVRRQFVRLLSSRNTVPNWNCSLFILTSPICPARHRTRGRTKRLTKIANHALD